MPADSIPITGFAEWEADIITEYRFKQIRAALHPKSGISTIVDKCHQLQASIQSKNEHVRRAFVPGCHCSFHEGDIASKSCYNQAPQYNYSKPDKYRIDFFILVNATAGKNFICFIDVYHGKKSTNAHTVEEAWNHPTTQKAVPPASAL